MPFSVRNDSQSRLTRACSVTMIRPSCNKRRTSPKAPTSSPSKAKDYSNTFSPPRAWIYTAANSSNFPPRAESISAPRAFATSAPSRLALYAPSVSPSFARLAMRVTRAVLISPPPLHHSFVHTHTCELSFSLSSTPSKVLVENKKQLKGTTKRQTPFLVASRAIHASLAICTPQRAHTCAFCTSHSFVRARPSSILRETCRRALPRTVITQF